MQKTQHRSGQRPNRRAGRGRIGQDRSQRVNSLTQNTRIHQVYQNFDAR